MKRFLFAAALLLCLSAMVVSCNKDSGGSSSSIVGTWNCVKEEYFDKDGNLENVAYYNDNKLRLVFTESVFTVYYNNSSQGTAAYQYDKAAKKILYGMGICLLVQKLTATEMVLISDESTYQKGVYGWDVMYLEKE